MCMYCTSQVRAHNSKVLTIPTFRGSANRADARAGIRGLARPDGSTEVGCIGMAKDESPYSPLTRRQSPRDLIGNHAGPANPQAFAQNIEVLSLPVIAVTPRAYILRKFKVYTY